MSESVQIPQPERPGDYLKNDAGRIIYEAVHCFAMANLRVTTIKVPHEFWHKIPSGAVTVFIHGAAVLLQWMPHESTVMAFEYVRAP